LNVNEARRRAAHPATEAGFARSFSSGHKTGSLDMLSGHPPAA
jgi:hypothetical protein